MIRINLLPHKKKSRSVSVEGEKVVGIGVGILLASAAMLFLFVHSPLQDDVDAQSTNTKKLKAENKKIEKRTKDFEKLKAGFKAAKTQAAAIETLNNARATPANFLYELALIMRQDGKPTLTTDMARELEENENLRWQEDWDPKHVWIDSLTEEAGAFKLKGSAQSDGDVTQLAHRLSASMYFDNVQPEGSVKKSTKGSGISVYNFTISGKVRY